MLDSYILANIFFYFSLFLLGSCSGQKRTRGRTRGIKLFNRRPGDKLIIQFNAEGQPIGENARSFSTLCGIVVRSPGNAPLQVKKWAEIPEQAKEKMWSHIQVNGNEYFSILVILMCSLFSTSQEFALVDEERKKWVMQSLGKKYRDYRKALKDRYYSPWNTDGERLQHPPPDVSVDDWVWLVRHWGSPEMQVCNHC